MKNKMLESLMAVTHTSISQIVFGFIFMPKKRISV